MEYESQTFEGIRLEGQSVTNDRFSDCEFYKCEFLENELENCIFTNCLFKNCLIINNTFLYSEAAGNQFESCTIIGMNWDKITKPHTIFMPFERFDQCVLKYNVFCKMKLKKINLQGCDLQGSFFEDCDLSEAVFCDCNLAETVFTNNNLSKADFRRAKGYTISLENNRVKKAKFSFPEVLGLLKCLEIEIE